LNANPRHRTRIVVTSGLRGYFAAMVDDDGPIMSGIGSYATAAGAAIEARMWAEAEELPFEDTSAPSVRRAVVPAQRSRWYAGVGSRKTPPDVLTRLTRIGRALAMAGYGLSSGAAPGADQAFERGADEGHGQKRIMLPWSGFESRTAAEHGVFDASKLPAFPQARAIAAQHHPAWERNSRAAQALHTRNAFQALGPELDQPVSFLICWTDTFQRDADGDVIDASGGTGTAVRIARTHRIPVFHLGIPEHGARIEAWVCRIEAQALLVAP
jgi:hypothetical protein